MVRAILTKPITVLDPDSKIYLTMDAGRQVSVTRDVDVSTEEGITDLVDILDMFGQCVEIDRSHYMLIN